MPLHLMNAAGTAKTVAHAKKLARSEALAEITMGSFTYEARPGNEGKVFHPEPGIGSLNSLGIPNGGREYLRSVIDELISIVECTGERQLRVSIAGSNTKELAALAKTTRGASTCEVNLGCPNVWDGGKQKDIWSFNPDRIGDAAIAVKEAAGDGSFVALKLSPYSDPGLFARVMDTLEHLAEEGYIDEVVYANAYPNAFLWTITENGGPEIAAAAISPAGGLAGGAGRGFLPFVLGGLRQLKQRLGKKVDITGVGGIVDGWSLAQHLLCDVDAVQINTAFYETDDPGVFSKIIEDFVAKYPHLAERYLQQ